MQSLRNADLWLGLCVLALVAGLGAASVGSDAAQQMADKRRITLQFRQDMQACESRDADEAERCARHAHAWAEVARAELASRRLALPPADDRRFAARYRTQLARWLRERGASRQG